MKSLLESLKGKLHEIKCTNKLLATTNFSVTSNRANHYKSTKLLIIPATLSEHVLTLKRLIQQIKASVA